MKAIVLMCVYFVGSRSFAEEYNLSGVPGLGYIVPVHIGSPHQKLNVLVDTGSSTLAIASRPGSDISTYFHLENSSSLYDTGKKVHAKYTKGGWSAKLVADYVQFPLLPSEPEVLSDIALITDSEEFFMNGSGWQGILGLAYPAVAARGDDVSAKPWLYAVDASLGKITSFSLKLCGVRNATNATHYGKFSYLDDETTKQNPNKAYKTPVLKARWYEVGILSIRVLTHKTNHSLLTVSDLDQGRNATKSESDADIVQSDCRKLNSVKSIVDSGTTNIRLPDVIFQQVTDELRRAAHSSGVIILDDFWYNGEAACLPEPQRWQLPWLAVDLLNADDFHQYFTIELPPENYMRLMSAHTYNAHGGAVSEYCYKLGFEVGVDTVLGVTAMEGLEVTFNRSSDWVGFQTSDCGPNARISGPFNTSHLILDYCNISRPVYVITTAFAQLGAICAVSFAMVVLLYLLAPCFKTQCIQTLRRLPRQVSVSRASLVMRDGT